MPCNTCDKDSGKFYGGSCPECLVERVRELEAINASLIGVMDGLFIEIRKMEVAGGELEAACAVMRDALNKWKLLAHFMNPPDDWRTGESLASLCQECILAGEQALSTTTGRDLLEKLDEAVDKNAQWEKRCYAAEERLEKLERVAEAAKKYRSAEFWHLGDSETKQRKEKAAQHLDKALADLDGDGNG